MATQDAKHKAKRALVNSASPAVHLTKDRLSNVSWLRDHRVKKKGGKRKEKEKADRPDTHPSHTFRSN